MNNAQLSSAISGTSNNTNGVATLDTPFADPDAESLRQKLNEFLLAARRCAACFRTGAIVSLPYR